MALTEVVACECYCREAGGSSRLRGDKLGVCDIRKRKRRPQTKKKRKRKENKINVKKVNKLWEKENKNNDRSVSHCLEGELELEFPS